MSQEGNPASGAEELSKKLDQIIRRLDLLEKLILEKPEYEGLAAALQLTRVGIGMYGEPLKVASRLKSAEKYMRQKAIAQDEISRCVVQAVAVHHRHGLNYSLFPADAIVCARGAKERRVDTHCSRAEHGVADC